MATGQTTAPAGGDSSRGEQRGVLALVWVAPAPVVIPTLLDGRIVRLGRDEGCDVVLAGSEASREHARIERDGPLTVVRDLGSRNGTYLNGSRIEAGPLAAGAVLRLGEWVGVVVSLPAGLALRHELELLAPGLFAGPVLSAALEPVRRAARSGLPVVVIGETGTGKEVVARAVHEWSGRQGAFVAVNCAALPASLAEAELFGHRKGAFTGADSGRLGHLRTASGGTLLLDELTDLPLEVQAKLLRALEQREVLPLGESRPVPVDVRVVAAAQEPLARAVAERRFRADLMARLDGVSVELPPLRVRSPEVPLLFDQFLQHAAQGAAKPVLEPALVEALCLHDWPLNVRELLQLARKLVVLNPGARVLKYKDLPTALRAVRPDTSTSPPPKASARPLPTMQVHESTREADERRERELAALIEALRAQQGNVSRAASAIGVSRARAYRLLNAEPDVDLDALRDPPKVGPRD